MKPPILDWDFPASTTHDGIPLGNGIFGALLWGDGNVIKVTINRQDYWDHRGGLVFGGDVNYQNLRHLLEIGDEEGLRKAFENKGRQVSGQPRRPTRLPMGRVDLNFPGEARLGSGELNLTNGEARVSLGRIQVRAFVPRNEPVVILEWVANSRPNIKSSPPDSEEVLTYFRNYQFPPVRVFDNHSTGGWIQERPADPALSVAWRHERSGRRNVLCIVAVYGESPGSAREAAFAKLELFRAKTIGKHKKNSRQWWRRYWNEAASLRIPERQIEELYWFGLYKLAGLSMPGTPAATLQGPWVEEYRMPPWSADYHFNINVQECYWLAYGANKLESLKPLFEMIQSWLPLLRRNAREFIGVEDGIMLPHAVDDRGTAMSGFWTGSIDHGSTAWVGQMMWQYYRYTLDVEFLRKTAYPFMKGAMRVYEAMLEKEENRYVLPISVSPEYNGAAMNAWGRNATFQLSNIHFLCRTLLEAAAVLKLDEKEAARWKEISEQLPVASTKGKDNHLQITLWEGQELDRSHRHHSHLAGIYPFDLLEFGPGEKHEVMVRNSVHHWVLKGMGEWTGWCMPWASILHSRLGNGESAVLLLEIFRRVFVRPSRASLVDGFIPGFTVLSRMRDVMQIEAAMGASAAVMEMLVHTKRGWLHVFPSVPREWKEIEFRGIRSEGAFIISGKKHKGRVDHVKIHSLAGETLRMMNPFKGKIRITQIQGKKRQIIEMEGERIELPTRRDDELILTCSAIRQ